MGFIVASILLISVQAYGINSSFGHGTENPEIFINFVNGSDYGTGHVNIIPNSSSNLSSKHWIRMAPVSSHLIYCQRRSPATLAESRSWLLRRSQIHIYRSIHLIDSGNKRAFGIIGNASPGGMGLEMEQSLPENNSSTYFKNSSLNSSNIVLPGQSIQSAMDAARPGSIISVYSGTYCENVYISKLLIIRGVDTGGGFPVIDAQGHGNAIEIAADQVELYNITATNSSGSGIGEPGAGIRISSRNCTIEGIRSYKNFYGISLVDSINNTLHENNFSDNFCGVRLYFSNGNTVNGNYIRDNSYGIRLSSSGNNTVVANTAIANKYGIDLASSSGNLIENNSLNGNSIKAIKFDDLNASNIISNNTGTEAGEKAEAKKITSYLPPSSAYAPEMEPSSQREVSGSSASSDSGSIGMGTYQMIRPTSTEELQRRIDEEVESLPWGLITFTPPERMTRGVGYPVVVRISRRLFDNMTRGLEKFEKIETEKIKVSYEMNMSLEGDSTIKISPRQQEPKVLPKTGFVEWTWEVTPLEPGNHTLKLAAMALICLNNGEKKIEVKVFEKDIEVYVDQVREIKSFFLSGGFRIIDLFIASLIEFITILLGIHAIESIKSMRKRGDEGKEGDGEDEGKNGSDKDDDTINQDS